MDLDLAGRMLVKWVIHKNEVLQGDRHTVYMQVKVLQRTKLASWNSGFSRRHAVEEFKYDYYDYASSWLLSYGEPCHGSSVFFFFHPN